MHEDKTEDAGAQVLVVKTHYLWVKNSFPVTSRIAAPATTMIRGKNSRPEYRSKLEWMILSQD